MKVRQLIELLNKCNPNTEVVTVIGTKKQEFKARIVTKVTDNTTLIAKTTILHLSTKEGYVDRWGTYYKPSERMETPEVVTVKCETCGTDYTEPGFMYDIIDAHGKGHYCHGSCVPVTKS